MTNQNDQKRHRQTAIAVKNALTRKDLRALLSVPAGTPTSISPKKQPIKLQKVVGTLNGMACLSVSSIRSAETGTLVGIAGDDSTADWDHGPEDETQTQSMAGFQVEIAASDQDDQEAVEIVAARGSNGAKFVKIRIELNQKHWEWAQRQSKRGNVLNFTVCFSQTGFEQLQGYVLDGYHTRPPAADRLAATARLTDG